MWFCMISRVVGAAKLCLFSAAVESIQVSAGAQQPSASQSATRLKTKFKKYWKGTNKKNDKEEKKWCNCRQEPNSHQQVNLPHDPKYIPNEKKWRKGCKENERRRRMNDWILGRSPTTAIGKLIYHKIQNGQKRQSKLKMTKERQREWKNNEKLKTLRKILVSAGAKQSSTLDSLENLNFELMIELI